MKGFLVRGTVRMARDWTKFAKEVAADSPESAIERVLSDLGSKHRLPRMRIKVKEVTDLPIDQVTDPVVRFRIEGAA
jgi:large subunit ribosomal protein LX